MLVNEFRKLPRQIHACCCLALLVVISWALLSQNPFAAVRNTPLSWLKTVSDLILHLAAYTVFSTACCSLIGFQGDPTVRRRVLILLVIHALGTEYLQHWMPYRTCDPLDAAANLSGIATGFLLSLWLVRVGSEVRA
jgi:VanZ family protein